MFRQGVAHDGAPRGTGAWRVDFMSDNLAYQLEWKEELIGGRIVAMSPAATNHNRIAGNIYRIFANYLDEKNCVPFGDNELVFLTDEDEFIPDFMVVCDRGKIRHDGIHGAPDLVVEVLSPGTAKYDKTHKKEVYARCGVREYWIVSPSDKIIDVYHGSGNEFVSHDVYTVYTDWMLAKMSDEERAAVITHFRCCLYDDLDISLAAVFKGLLP